jgi:hypothetical protein
MSKMPHFLDYLLTDGGYVVSLKRRSRFISTTIIFLLPVLISVRGLANPRSMLRQIKKN